MGPSRVSKYSLPSSPRVCLYAKSCVYRDKITNVCDDVFINKSNGDAACHTMGNARLLKIMLVEVKS